MEKIILEVQSRKELGKSLVRDLRKSGFIPAVVYAQGKESLPIKVPYRDLLRLIHEHRLDIENLVINLSFSSSDKKADKPRPCLIKEIQYDPVNDDLMHVDFNQISMTKQVKVNIPIVSKGEPVGVKQDGGSLEHILWEVEIECLPTDIPKGIEVDVSKLKIGDSIHIKDISFPSTLKVLNDPEATVLSVAAPIKEEPQEAPLEGEAAAEPEVIKEKKEKAPGEEKPKAEEPKKEK